MSASVTDLLFVYGTLRRAMANEMSGYLAAHADDLGAATCPGRIYDLGSYPGLVTAGDGSTVHGEVFRLHEPAASLPFLDDYEGLNLVPPQYERLALSVTLRARPDEPVPAWVYVYLLPLGTAVPIPSGDYLNR